jgi:hypothetical protein
VLVVDECVGGLVPGVPDGAALQNLAAAVWSGVRVVLESWPMLVTSARTAVYPGVFIGGGGAGRNWLACSSRNGRTDPQLVNIGGPNFGGVRRYAPGAVPATNAAGGVADPSASRSVSSARAAAEPTATPSRVGVPAGSPASCLASWLSRVARIDGYSPSMTSCAAWSAAASGRASGAAGTAER